MCDRKRKKEYLESIADGINYTINYLHVRPTKIICNDYTRVVRMLNNCSFCNVPIYINDNILDDVFYII